MPRRIRLPLLDSLLGSRRGTEVSPSLVVVGLGNPGPGYAQTRHNVGFWCVEHLAAEHAIALGRRHRSALVGTGEIAGHPVALAKPRTFVNRSGDAVRYVMDRFGVSPEGLLIIYDDINLGLGRLRLRPRGSAGGHNGIKSIIQSLGTQDFPRLRVGVGKPEDGTDQIGYVLGEMSGEERRIADEAVARVGETVAAVLSDGIAAAMGRFN